MRQVDDQPVVDAAEPGTVVAAAADGDRQLVVAPEVDRRDHVADVGAARDQQRPLVDHGVVERAGLVIVRVAGADHVPRRLWANVLMSSVFMAFLPVT